MAEQLDTLAASFRRDLRAERRTERTITVYLQAIRFFADWLTGHGHQPTLDQLTRNNLRDWLAELADTKAASTARVRWRGMHRFCGWLVTEGELASHPMNGLRMPAPVTKPVPILSDEQLTALLKACTGSQFYARRDEAVIRFLLDCGVRVSELCGIRQRDLDLDSQLALVTGKGDKVRPVYFGTRTARALDRYRRARAKHPRTELDAFFLSERGPLSPDGVRNLLRTRAQAAGIDAEVHPHAFRHTFAHDFLANGGQERDLKRLAGWSSDAMLERYGASAADMRARDAARRLRRGDRL